MVMLYFSGTGNSKYIAELFCKYMAVDCHSIEENINFEQLISQNEIIGFCYPIYGSRVPRIMREFAKKYIEIIRNKKVIIFCTQFIFSGDGARAFMDIFPKDFIKVIYAEHFFMPNNINNIFILHLASEKKIKKYITKAEQKIRKICCNIKNNKIKRRGFNILSGLLGLIQGIFIPIIEKKATDIVKIGDGCTRCCLCVSICPMNNLEYMDNKIVSKNNCTFCYRCINKCPEKAITLFINKKVKSNTKE